MTRRIQAIAALCGAALIGTAAPAGAALITAWYGDDDGFGIGATSGTINAIRSNATATDAPGTDRRLIGNAAVAGFVPTGSLSYAFDIRSRVTTATLTMRLGSFTPTNPLGGANRLRLDGIDFSGFLVAFTSNVPSGNRVQTLTFTLPETFFAALTDGTVSLAGTRITEGQGRGSFQVDFLRLDIATAQVAVSEPPALALLGAGLLGLGLVARRERKDGPEDAG